MFVARAGTSMQTKPEQKLNERILPPVPEPSSKEDVDVLANKVYSLITKSYEA